MESLTSHAWQGFRDKFQLEAAMTLSAADLAGLRKTAQLATFEERFTLINRVARHMCFRKELDEDLQEILVILYKGIFRELSLRRANLPERDQRKLAAVFRPVSTRKWTFSKAILRIFLTCLIRPLQPAAWMPYRRYCIPFLRLWLVIAP
jgi:hypothetical protein